MPVRKLNHTDDLQFDNPVNEEDCQWPKLWGCKQKLAEFEIRHKYKTFQDNQLALLYSQLVNTKHVSVPGQSMGKNKIKMLLKKMSV